MKKGHLRIGTLYDFRDEERLGSEIGDKDEGTKTLTTDGYHLIDTKNSNTIPRWLEGYLDGAFKPVGDDARLQIHAQGGVRLRLTVRDRYVFCASFEFDSALIKNGEYDTCIEIFDPKSFFYTLSKKLKYNASYLAMGNCLYKPRIILGEQDQGQDPSFIKEDRYSYQKEFRAIWSANNSSIEPLFIEAKLARRFCRYKNT